MLLSIGPSCHIPPIRILLSIGPRCHIPPIHIVKNFRVAHYLAYKATRKVSEFFIAIEIGLSQWIGRVSLASNVLRPNSLTSTISNSLRSLSTVQP
jgi:hypothetical protein